MANKVNMYDKPPCPKPNGGGFHSGRKAPDYDDTAEQLVDFLREQEEDEAWEDFNHYDLGMDY